jgi:hypothetical protein
MKTAATTLYPFVPAGPDFQVALEFFAELGFAQEWSHPGLAGLRFGGAYFILQEANVREWQENQMITFEVADLDGYWAELEPKKLPVRFPGVRIKPPIDFPWGREMHVIDPAGVCWHIRQAKDAD